MLFACRLVADYPKCEKEGVDFGSGVAIGGRRNFRRPFRELQTVPRS